MSDKISVRELPKVLQEKAIKELNEDPKRVPEDIAYIKNWLQQQRYITARMDDQFILTFLRGCKFSLERTKEKLDMYYTMKSLMKEVYENRDPLLPEIQEILNLGTGLPLINEVVPGTPGVMLLRNGVFDPTKISQENLMKTHVMLMDIGLMEDDNSLISGIYIVQDMKGMTLNHITSMSPSLMKKGMTCFQKAYPNRIKGMFVINPSPVFDTLFKLASPFMTEKLRSRVRNTQFRNEFREPLEGAIILSFSNTHHWMSWTKMNYYLRWSCYSLKLKRELSDDQFILTFLRGCKFSLERTKEKLETYYTVKSLAPEIYENRDPLLPEIQEILNLGTGLPILKGVALGTPGVILIRNGVFDPIKISAANLVKTSIMLMDIGLMEDDNSHISGLYILQDMKGITISHITSMSPSLRKKAMTCFQQAYPNRIKGMFFINTSGLFETLFKLFSPLMTEKIRSRVRVFSNLEELYTVIPKSVLPEEYGGDGGKVADLQAYWKQKVESYRDWYLDDEKYKTNESLRPGKPQTSESLFGIDGSFRQLTVD